MKLQLPGRIGLFLILVLTFSCTESDLPKSAFRADGETVYHIKRGTIKRGRTSIITASIHGIVQAYTPSGKLLWKADTDGGFPFDLCVKDINGDGLDETLVASGNGTLYAFSHNGERLWTFSKVPPLYRVSVAYNEDGNAQIFTGGPELVLYSLSPDGEVMNQMPTEHCIRHIRTGKILNDGKDYVVMVTTSSGLSGDLSLFLIDPADLSLVWKRKDLGKWGANTGKRFFSMLIMDLNKDGYEDILLSGGWGENGRIYAYNHRGEDLYMKSDEKIPNVPYRMNLLRPVTMPEDTFILGHFGNYLISYEMNGDLREVLHGNYSYADVCFDSESNTLFMGSEVSGGDGIYAIRLDQPGWQEKYESIAAVGRMDEIQANLEKLTEQIENFKAPEYQPQPKEIRVISSKPRGKEFKHLRFIRATRMTQQITDPDELWCRSTDRRLRYDMSLEEMIERASEFEKEGSDFIIWAGHGSAMYFPLSTFEELIKAAPNHLLGFELAEMVQVDEHMQKVVTEIVLPVAELCKKYDKFLIFRNKYVFWNGACYLPFWRKVLLNEKYSDVIIPGLEETNCRTQELSLAGRMGLWQTGSFDSWACRTVTDNSNFDRMFEWGGHQLLTHQFRNMVSSASLGSDIFFNNVHAGPDSDSLYQQFTPFYEMLEKGIIYVPEREDILSLSELALGIKDPPSQIYLEHGTNGHNYWFPEKGETEMVFNRLDAYYGGSSLPPYDFSYFALNVERRMTNFLPEFPYGMIAIVPSETPVNGRFKNIIETDGHYYYDKEGDRKTASEYHSVVEESLKEAARNLPVRVEGEVHWSAARLDSSHLRITLVDPGYLDPAERNAEIVLQNIEAMSCTDILSGESLGIEDGRIRISIPAGVFRIVDLEHKSANQQAHSGTAWSGSDTLVKISRIDSLKSLGYAMEDLHAHLKGGLTLDQLMEYSERTGITYGVAANCGIGFPITNDSALMEYYHSLEGYPFYKGLQAEGREWINLFSVDSVKKFEYAFTDAMTFTDDKGRRTRLWINDEVWVEDKQAFMDMLVDRIVGIMENEPVQIYVNSTFLPEEIQDEYDELWTDERMEKVIHAAAENGIAIEINARFKIPSAPFIKKAKAAGVKFTMGTNNTGPELGFLEYPITMIQECNLEPDDFYVVKR